MKLQYQTESVIVCIKHKHRPTLKLCVKFVRQTHQITKPNQRMHHKWKESRQYQYEAMHYLIYRLHCVWFPFFQIVGSTGSRGPAGESGIPGYDVGGFK